MQSDSANPSAQKPPIDFIELDGKTTPISMLIGLKDSKNTKAHIDMCLKKVTHLHLENKKIEVLNNVHLCVNLTHGYFQDNYIYTMVNEPFKDLTRITQLSLYSNRIDKMEGLISLVNLKRLYIEKNCISKLDGLDNCRMLEELYIGN